MRDFPDGTAYLEDQYPCTVWAIWGQCSGADRRDVDRTPPSPRDKTAQAMAFRGRNSGKTKRVRVWPAVRFGQALVADLRFMPGVAYDYPEGMHSIGAVPPPPYQTFNRENQHDGRPISGQPLVGETDWIGMGTAESADCLFYTVYAPKPAPTDR